MHPCNSTPYGPLLKCCPSKGFCQGVYLCTLSSPRLDTWITWVVPQGEVLWGSHLITQGGGEDVGCYPRATAGPSMRGSGPTSSATAPWGGGMPAGAAHRRGAVCASRVWAHQRLYNKFYRTVTGSKICRSSSLCCCWRQPPPKQFQGRNTTF